ncbi:MAG: hypothetical protein OXC19_17450 [Bryobacterales bacterium]|nr:hypothetical protein [Bryobacterales bacterium]
MRDTPSAEKRVKALFRNIFRQADRKLERQGRPDRARQIRRLGQGPPREEQ